MFDIDLQSRTPIYEQLYRRVTELVVKRQLMPGDKLPSVRELAKSLGVNPNTVSKAFQNLERDGVIYSLPGRGSFISEKSRIPFVRTPWRISERLPPKLCCRGWRRTL